MAHAAWPLPRYANLVADQELAICVPFQVQAMRSPEVHQVAEEAHKVVIGCPSLAPVQPVEGAVVAVGVVVAPLHTSMRKVIAGTAGMRRMDVQCL